MQSLLQYRRFGKHVARQYERDKAKAEALANYDNDNSEPTSPSATSNELNNAPETAIGDTSDAIDRRDPEKGEHSNGRLPGTRRDVEAQGSEKEEEEKGQSQGYLPIRVAPTARRPSPGREAPTDMSKATTVPSGKSIGTALGTTLTGIDIRDRSTKEGGDGKVFVVGYEGERTNLPIP